MAERVSLALQGERLDQLAERAYGTEQGGTMEALLDFNRRLAERPIKLPVGERIGLPDVTPPPAPGQINLWE